MVQLPATAAIEYVAAGHFFPGGLLAGGIFVRGVFCPGDFPRESFARGHFWPGDFCLRVLLSRGGLLSGGLCPFPPSSMRIRTVWAFCAYHRSVTDKQKKQKEKDKLGLVAPRGVDRRSPNFQGM